MSFASARGLPLEQAGGRRERVFHTYTAYARGLDQLATPYNFLDLTPYGRQEDWEDSPPDWPQRPTYG